VVTLWGRGPHGSLLGIDEVARAAGTIGYELMCALAPRVPVQVDTEADDEHADQLDDRTATVAKRAAGAHHLPGGASGTNGTSGTRAGSARP
jgi:hypothetical protein